MFIYAAGAPLGVIALWILVSRPGWHKAHATVLGLLISLIFTSFITDLVKNAVGRPRPDLIARCKPKSTTPKHELVSIDICEETDHHLLQDGWRSFPSGHSSFAFAGLGFLAMCVHLPASQRLLLTMRSVLAGQMHVLRPRTDLARVLITIAPLLGALMIAISRCEDYRHDVYDVTVGSTLGLFVAYTTYRRYYPSLRSHNCHEPYLPVADNASLAKQRDEELGLTSGEDSDGERVPLRDRTID